MTATRASAVAIATALAITAIAGCSTGGTAPAPSTTALAPPNTQDMLDVGTFTSKPCDLLRPEQLPQYGVATPGTASGSVCHWTPDDKTRPTFQAGTDVTSGGLEQLYRRRSQFPAFAPTVVSGYPAVNIAAGQGECTVQVGVAKTALLTVTVASGDPKSPSYTGACHEADLIAASAMANIKTNSP